MTVLTLNTNNFFDPITLDLMNDPVICVDGHTYERQSIEKWFENKNTSPLTLLPLSSKTLTPNISLRQMISEYKEQYNPEHPAPPAPLTNQFIENMRSWHGTSSGIYTGNINVLKQPDGKGVMTYNDGDKYDGEWKDGEWHGSGVETCADGDKYEGEYKNGYACGRGAITYSNGDKYDGEWQDNEEHGRGVYTWADGHKYEGEWKDGKWHGSGVETTANGNKFQNKWDNGKKYTIYRNIISKIEK